MAGDGVREDGSQPLSAPERQGPQAPSDPCPAPALPLPPVHLFLAFLCLDQGLRGVTRSWEKCCSRFSSPPTPALGQQWCNTVAWSEPTALVCHESSLVKCFPSKGPFLHEGASVKMLWGMRILTNFCRVSSPRDPV